MLDILNGTIELGEKVVTLFRSLKTKLTGDKTGAAKSLADVMDELIKFFRVTQQEVSNFQGLDFINTGALAKTKQVLNDVQSGEMRVRIEEARGRCSKIEHIYNDKLNNWFIETFKRSSDEYQEVQNLFDNLTKLDLNFIQATENLEGYLKMKGGHLLEKLKNNNQEAADYHDSVSAELLTTRQKLSTVVTRLVELKNEFDGLAGVV